MTTMPHQMTQPERVEYMLSALDLSAAKFAKACGLTEATVSRWRSGQCKISQARAHQIEDTFPQFSTSWIMGDTKFTNDTAKTFEGMTTCFVLIRLEPGEDTEVLGVFASMETVWHAMYEAVRSDEETSYMIAETEVFE